MSAQQTHFTTLTDEAGRFEQLGELSVQKKIIGGGRKRFKKRLAGLF